MHIVSCYSIVCHSMLYDIITGRPLLPQPQPDPGVVRPIAQDSSKGGAVETGCSDLHDIMH